MTYRCLTDDIHNFILFSVPKAGCTSWKSFLIESTISNLTVKVKHVRAHDFENMKTVGLYLLNSYNKVSILQRLNSYVVALTVRHPFSRLESGFKGKVLLLKAKNKNKDISETELELDYPEVALKLEKFIQNYVVKLKEKMDNLHFKSIFDLANPCLIPYK